MVVGGGRPGGQVGGGHPAGLELLLDRNAGQVVPPVSVQLCHVPDGIPDAPLEPKVELPVVGLIVVSEQPAGDELHHDVVRPFLALPLVPVACVPHGGGDVAGPAEATHPFQGLPVGMVMRPGNDLLQLTVEELVVLLGVERVVVLAKEPELCHPLHERQHEVDRVGESGSDAGTTAISGTAVMWEMIGGELVSCVRPKEKPLATTGG